MPTFEAPWLIMRWLSTVRTSSHVGGVFPRRECNDSIHRSSRADPCVSFDPWMVCRGRFSLSWNGYWWGYRSLDQNELVFDVGSRCQWMVCQAVGTETPDPYNHCISSKMPHVARRCVVPAESWHDPCRYSPIACRSTSASWAAFWCPLCCLPQRGCDPCSDRWW